GSIPVVLAFGRRPLIETIIIDEIAEQTQSPEHPAVIELPVAERIEESSITPSSVLDQSSTQVIVLPKISETTDE
ncbi:MAG: hypothetical protein ACKOAF_03645, partial [Actinomycetes bacterium]